MLTLRDGIQADKRSCRCRCSTWVETPAIMFHLANHENLLHYLNDGFLLVLQTLIETGLVPSAVSRWGLLRQAAPPLPIVAVVLHNFVGSVHLCHTPHRDHRVNSYPTPTPSASRTQPQPQTSSSGAGQQFNRGYTLLQRRNASACPDHAP